MKGCSFIHFTGLTHLFRWIARQHRQERGETKRERKSPEDVWLTGGPSSLSERVSLVAAKRTADVHTTRKGGLSVVHVVAVQCTITRHPQSSISLSQNDYLESA